MRDSYYYHESIADYTQRSKSNNSSDMSQCKKKLRSDAKEFIIIRLRLLPLKPSGGSLAPTISAIDTTMDGKYKAFLFSC